MDRFHASLLITNLATIFLLLHLLSGPVPTEQRSDSFQSRKVLGLDRRSLRSELVHIAGADPLPRPEITPNSISVILTVWKRNHTEQQIQHILQQTVPVENIFIWQTKGFIDVSDVRIEHPNVRFIYSDYDFKYHGRFLFGLALDTEFVAIFDDDVMPQPRYLENCLRVCKEKNALVGGVGRIWRPNSYYQMVDFPNRDVEVDFVGHSWFLKTEWLRLFWSEEQPTWENGEDIALASILWLKAKIRAFVPSHPRDNYDLWSDYDGSLGHDEHATWRKENHAIIRRQINNYFILRGWVPLVARNEYQVS
jgi:hypothetical protein